MSSAMSPKLSLTPERVGAGVWRLALPSETLPPYEHTNSYVVQSGDEAVLIDAGAADPDVLDALASSLTTLGVGRLNALLLTHTHPDHVAGAAAVRGRCGVNVYVHKLEQNRLEFPARNLADGDVVTVGDQAIGVHHTPGHSPGHLSFALGASGTQIVLVGDLLTAQGSTWVGLPEGNVSDYLASLDTLSTLIGSDKAVFGPGHGPLVHQPEVRLREVRAHRLRREAQVLAALTKPLTLAALRERIYPGLPAALTPLTEGALLAQLEKLVSEKRVVQSDADKLTWLAASTR